MNNENNSIEFDEIYEAEVRGAMLVLASFMFDDAGGRALAEELVQKARNAQKHGVRLSPAEADTEQSVHDEAVNERQRVVAYLQNRADRCLSPDGSFLMTDLAAEIERGEHE